MRNATPANRSLGGARSNSITPSLSRRSGRVAIPETSAMWFGCGGGPSAEFRVVEIPNAPRLRLRMCDRGGEGGKDCQKSNDAGHWVSRVDWLNEPICRRRSHQRKIPSARRPGIPSFYIAAHAPKGPCAQSMDVWVVPRTLCGPGSAVNRARIGAALTLAVRSSRSVARGLDRTGDST